MNVPDKVKPSPDLPMPVPDPEPETDPFEQTLSGLYGNVEWSQEEQDFLRATGLI